MKKPVSGLFTANGTGCGQAAAVNQNGTLNGAENSAVRGEIVALFRTGEGQTEPLGVSGLLTASVRVPRQAAKVRFGAVDADVLCLGPAPGLAP